MLALIGAAVIIGIMGSTAEERAAARVRMQRWNLPFLIAAALIWLALLWPG